MIGLCHAVPAPVAIHSVIAAAHRRDRDGPRQRRDEARNVVPCRVWRRIATVGKRMYHRRHGGFDENSGERRGMILMRMHSPRRHQAYEMAGTAALPQALDQAREGGRSFDLAAGDRRIDARQVLHHETTGADVEMPDLGIAHLSLWQADVFARSAQEGVRTARPQTVESGSASLSNGVVSGLLAPAPAVKHDQHDWTTLLHLLTSSASRQRH